MPRPSKRFGEVHRRAPGWIPGAINLAIALLNDNGVKAEQAKKAGGDAAADNFDEALDLLAGVLKRDPHNPYAHFCRGIILEQQGADRGGASSLQARYGDRPQRRCGLVLVGQHFDRISSDPSQPAGPKQAKEQIAFYAQGARTQPLPDASDLQDGDDVPIHGDRRSTTELIERWRKINPDRQEPSPGPGDSADKVYGEMGKYASVINPFPRARAGP